MVRCVSAKLRTKIGPKESSTLTNHIIENEEPVGKWQKLNFSLTQRKNFVIGADEFNKARLCECVGRI